MACASTTMRPTVRQTHALLSLNTKRWNAPTLPQATRLRPTRLRPTRPHTTTTLPHPTRPTRPHPTRPTRPLTRPISLVLLRMSCSKASRKLQTTVRISRRRTYGRCAKTALISTLVARTLRATKSHVATAPTPLSRASQAQAASETPRRPR